ncbi:hypothetical protein HXA35_03635 [Bacillus sp. A301a_S52]|nr:hypothetical protein [Bacillus sp. A301a_S52]
MSSPIQNNPAFSAYSRLTVVNNFLARKEGREPDGINMSFKEFTETLEKNEVVKKENVRPTNELQRHHSRTNAAFNGVHWEQSTLSYIDKAFELGLVNSSGTLINLKG